MCARAQRPRLRPLDCAVERLATACTSNIKIRVIRIRQGETTYVKPLAVSICLKTSDIILSAKPSRKLYNFFDFLPLSAALGSSSVFVCGEPRAAKISFNRINARRRRRRRVCVSGDTGGAARTIRPHTLKVIKSETRRGPR